jgi:hypothetical protein
MKDLMKTKKGRSLLMDLTRLSPSLAGSVPVSAVGPMARALVRPGISGFVDVRSDGSNFAQHLDWAP